MLQLPGVGATQAAWLRSKGVATLRNLGLRGEHSAKKILEGCGLASVDEGRGKSRRAAAGRGGGEEGRSNVGAALRALSAVPVVKGVSFGVRSKGGGVPDGVGFILLPSKSWMVYVTKPFCQYPSIYMDFCL